MTQIGTEENPVRVAIVGAGPSGFYAAEHILKDADTHAQVDLFDRLPTPFGLVRGGVAPDHPKIKSVIRVYEKTAARDGYRFFGNVDLGRDLSPAEVAERYHAVIYAYGSETDRHLGIPGEDLPGSDPATAFVGWYNAHPDYADHEFDLSCERAVGEMVDADIHVDPAELELDELSRRYLENDADITARKNVEILTEFANKPPEGKSKRIVLRFLTSPIEIQGDGRVERVVVGRNELHRDESGAIRPRDSGERETIEAGLVLRSIGYKGIAIEGIPFDKRRGVIPNEGGRVIDPGRGGHLPGQYAVGWIKRGPSGVIGTNKKDAQETVDNLVEDLEAGRVPEPPQPEPGAIEALLRDRKPDHVTLRGWEAIDRAEVDRGKPHGRPRVKFCRVEEMVEVSREADPVAG